MRLVWASLSIQLLLTLSCLGNPLAQLEQELKAWIEHGDLVGVEVLVIEDGETLLHGAYGWKDREARLPMQTNRIFSLASLTKPVTALATLMLVDEGRLSLDDKVNQFIPGFRGDARATVRDLLAQTSGDDGHHGDGGYNIYDFATLADWVADWATTEATGEYGQFGYSNFNYAALGFVVQRVAGVGLGEFVTQRILEPLGMHDSFVAFDPDAPWAERVPTSYMWSAESKRYEVFWTPDRPQRWRFFPGALGLWGTAMDYARFASFWLDQGMANGRRLLSEELVRDALRPHGFRDGEATYGFGWFIDPSRTEDDFPLAFRHGGGDGTLALVYPAERGIVLYLSQSERPPDHVETFQNRIAMSGLFRHPGPYMVWAAESGLHPLPLGSAPNADYVGSYRGTVPWLDGSEWAVELRAIDDVLELGTGDASLLLRDHVQLVPLGMDLFGMGRYEQGKLVGVDPPMRVRFLREDGLVSGLEVSADGELEFRVEKDGRPR